MPIEYVESRQIWILATNHTSYAFGVNGQQYLQHIYWGERLPFADDFALTELGYVNGKESSYDILNLEYPAWGGIYYAEPCIKATFPDGVRDLILRYDGFEIAQGDAAHLIVTLKDPFYDFVVKLHYKLIEELDLIERYSEIVNQGSAPIQLELAQSAQWTVPGNHSYRLTHLAGKWGGETQVRQSRLNEGKTVLESRRGNTGNQANPWFALDRGHAKEDEGGVWFGALSWSGSWKITAEVTPFYQVRVSGGLNEFDFAWQLEPGESFVTPAFTAGYANGGFGQASRNMHRYQLRYLLPDAHAVDLRQVLYNSWEATEFDIDEKEQLALARKAASLGVELFVLDDGWFGKRNNDSAGLGDWYVNREKFPNGLNAFIGQIKELGMNFGIWVEPEMVNPDSDLYRQHPDWVVHFPNRPRSKARNQLLLNLGRDDVREFIFGFMDELLGNHDITFIKWDMNRVISEPGWPEMPVAKQREIWVRYVQGLYGIIDRLKAKYPHVVLETCSSGGGRVDNGILRRMDQVWTSDNTNAYDRLTIQEGYSYAYCPKTMVAWVTDLAAKQLSLRYRFHSAMMGTLGIGANLHHWTQEEMEEAAEWISLYKEIRPIVQNGLQYRLSSPREGRVTAVQYVSESGSESVLIVLSTNQAWADPVPNIYLRGLEPGEKYRVEGMPNAISGRSLMSQGIRVSLEGLFASRLLRIVQEVSS